MSKFYNVSFENVTTISINMPIYEENKYLYIGISLIFLIIILRRKRNKRDSFSFISNSPITLELDALSNDHEVHVIFERQPQNSSIFGSACSDSFESDSYSSTCVKRYENDDDVHDVSEDSIHSLSNSYMEPIRKT